MTSSKAGRSPSEPVARRFSDYQLALLEKLNRADLAQDDFDATPSWRSLKRLGRNIELPALHLRDPEGTILR